MQRLSVEELEPGMIVARTILNSDGRPLLAQNTTLTEHYINRLKELGLTTVYVKNDLGDVEIPEVVSSSVRLAVTKSLKSSVQTIPAKGRLDTKSLKKSVGLLVDDIMSNRDVLFAMYDVCAHSDILLFHSINVCILAVMTGISLGYNELSLMELGVGALLHDIGMATIPPEILNKPGALTEAEAELVRKHPESGFNILRAQGDIPLRSSHIAFQHHERWDGSGYPRGMSGNDILEYARIVAVADVFEALASDRPYREAYAINDIFTILRKLSGVYFDPDILDVFISNIAPYPVGSMVKLNNGHVAVVLSVNKSHPHRPEVACIVGTDGNLLVPAMKVDLSGERHLQIVKLLTGKEFKLLRTVLNQKVAGLQQNSFPSPSSTQKN